MAKILSKMNFMKNEASNMVFEALAAAPSDPKSYQYYFDTVSNCLMYYNGTEWKPLTINSGVVFKGTIGDDASGATVTSLPMTKAGAVAGYEYMVITAGDYVIDGSTSPAKAHAVVGDMFICTTAYGTSASDVKWTLIPSGNDKFVGTITGDDSTKSFTFLHNLGTEDVQVQIFDASGNMVITDVQSLLDGTNKPEVIVSFEDAPATGDSYKVVILA